MVNYDTPRQYLNLTGQIFDIYHHSVSCDLLTYGGLPFSDSLCSRVVVDQRT